MKKLSLPNFYVRYKTMTCRKLLHLLQYAHVVREENYAMNYADAAQLLHVSATTKADAPLLRYAKPRENAKYSRAGKEIRAIRNLGLA